MKILVITQYFPPESGAPSNRLKSFADAMASRNHDVTVICEFPNYPSGIMAKEDKWRLFRIERDLPYRVIRTFVIGTKCKNALTKLLFYISFALSSFCASLFVRKPDVIFTSSPPIFHALGSTLIAKIKKSRFVLDIRDLWPDTVREFNAMSNKTFMKWGAIFEKWLYLNSDLIVTVSQGIKAKIEARGGNGKCHLAYNGSFQSILEWNGSGRIGQEWRGFANETIIMYAGRIGLGQKLSDLIPSMLEMKESGCRFVIIGDGPDKNRIENILRKHATSSIILGNSVSSGDVIPYLYAADILMVILKKGEFFKSALPSKFFDYMAAGKPILSNVDGELREIMETYNTGIYFAPDDPEAFKVAILTLINNPELMKTMGINGKKLVREKFLRSKIAEKAISVIEQIARSS